MQDNVPPTHHSVATATTGQLFCSAISATTTVPSCPIDVLKETPLVRVLVILYASVEEWWKKLVEVRDSHLFHLCLLFALSTRFVSTTLQLMRTRSQARSLDSGVSLSSSVFRPRGFT